MKEFEARMRSYELSTFLPSNMPIIIRIDGRSFKKFTRGMERPFDEGFIEMMNEIAKEICRGIQFCRMAYLQSDEISFLVYQKDLDNTGWFNNKIEKMCSVISSKASSIATKWVMDNIPDKNPIVSFDARANVYPIKEVSNYFIWRQKDWERNSLFMVARSYYSSKELKYKKSFEQQDMVFKAGDNWDNYSTYLKRGRCCIKVRTTEFVKNEQFEGEVERSRWIIENEIPQFVKNRDFIMNKLDDDFVKTNRGLIIGDEKNET